MWSYYADSHHGVCFEFDIPDDRLSEYEIAEVKYTAGRAVFKVRLVKKTTHKQGKNRMDITIDDIRPLFF